VSSPPTANLGSRPVDHRLRLRQPAGAQIAAGASCVVLGGLVAAVTGPLALAEGSWLAAYLVLVCGVAQYAIGRAPELLSARPVDPRSGWAQLGCWTLGNVAVIGGTLSGAPIMDTAGGALLVAGLGIAWHAARGRNDPTAGRPTRIARWTYRCLLLVLLVSVPIGVVLANLRGRA
jgi:hypothetical protein